MTDWLVRSDGAVLEPSFGQGVFLRALADTRDATGLDLRVLGAEIDERAHERAVADGLIDAGSSHLGDFLATSPIPVIGAVGNPPYVRLRHLPEDQRVRALAVARSHLGHDMDPSGSVWMPFVLHASAYLRPGGRLAFVLPFDVTYVRYARPLWRFLGRTFGRLLVIRVRERLFPEILQDTVLLLADARGRSTSSVLYRTYESLQDLVVGRPATSATISLEDICTGERPFMRALLPAELLDLLDDRLESRTMRARDLMSFNIGYVTGHKTFFHPDEAVIRRYDLPATSLRPTLTSGRKISGQGVRTSTLKPVAIDRLFCPSNDLTPGERRYVRHGEATGASQRYKCRIRDPWYQVDHVRVPDVVLSVFAERPLLLLNDANLVASNSFLCGYAKPGIQAERFVAAWYCSLTLLQAELEVHSLGGGVFVLVPNEAGRIRVPKVGSASTTLLARVNGCLARGDLAGAYQSGDGPALMDGAGLRAGDVELIRAGIEQLARWRLATQSSTRSGE